MQSIDEDVIQCASCKTNNPAGAKFCNSCGGTLSIPKTMSASSASDEVLFREIIRDQEVKVTSTMLICGGSVYELQGRQSNYKIKKALVWTERKQTHRWGYVLGGGIACFFVPLLMPFIPLGIVAIMIGGFCFVANLISKARGWTVEETYYVCSNDYPVKKVFAQTLRLKRDSDPYPPILQKLNDALMRAQDRPGADTKIEQMVLDDVSYLSIEKL